MTAKLNILGMMAMCVLFSIAGTCDKDRPFATAEVTVVLQPLSEHLVSANSSELVLRWYDVLLDLVRERPGFVPPVAARSLGYTSITLYEALVYGMPEYLSLSATLRIPEIPPIDSSAEYNWMICANAALSFAAKNYYGSLTTRELERVNALEDFFTKKYADGNAAVLEFSAVHGNKVASAIFQWSQSDGGSLGHLKNFKKYARGPVAPGMWESTSFTGALLPEWGNNRPFLSASVATCKSLSPPVYSDEKGSQLYQEAVEVYNAFNRLTAAHSDIARFWADPAGITFTPAGHSFKLLCQIVQREDVKMDFTVVTFAKLGIALNDAMVSCWKAKYQQNFVRPVTYIRKHIRSDWRPFINTPPFPEYPSGHSVQAGAMAEVLSAQFGDRYAFTDVSNDTLGYAPRRFASFEECAKEIAISRLYGGIHFRSAIEDGLVQGKKIGAIVNAIQWKKDVPLTIANE